MADRELKSIIGKFMSIEDHNNYRKQIYSIIKPNMSKRELEKFDELFPYIEHHFTPEEINQIISLRLQLERPQLRMAQLGMAHDMDIHDVDDVDMDMGGGRRKKHKRYRKKSKKSHKHSRRLRK